MNKRKQKRKPPVSPCPECGGETSCGVIYTDGTETRRCGRRRCGVLTMRHHRSARSAA